MMQTDDYGSFFALLDATMQTYGRQAPNMNDGVVDLWFNALAGYELATIRQALSRHVTDPDTGQYPPKIADIVRLVEGTAQDRATLAWAKVYKAAQRVGRYRSVAFDDPIIHAVVEDMGGMPVLCDMTEDDLRHEERRFCEKYRAFARHGCSQWPPYLVGLEEREQRGAGWHDRVWPPMLIGDAEGARKVMEAGVAQARIPVQGAAGEAAGTAVRAISKSGPAGTTTGRQDREPVQRRAPSTDEPSVGPEQDGGQGDE